ncbi:hypothetical protein [Microbacterium sp. cf046]|uniref:hypothetical protein n=1 Tax=Microbacterium sp. cf046 TaxID=1761803 RepID=UPI0011136292|nr:hypothetical protein [Microbacterium sp. cf046]
MNGEDLWLAYDRNTGAATTGHLTPDGTAHPLTQFQLDPTWEFILPTTGGVNIFFRLSQDQVSTGVFGADGRFTDLVTSPLGGFFHRVTVLPAGLVMWNRTVSENGEYRSVSVIGRVHADGRHEVISEQLLLDFWTHIVHVGEGLLLFYNSRTRLAATGLVTGDGGFRDLGQSFEFDTWTTILSAGDGNVLFYNTATGDSATGRVDADGGYTDLHSQFLGPMGFVTTTRGGFVIIRSADTLAAHLDERGVFSDTVIVRGLPTERRIVFVR